MPHFLRILSLMIVSLTLMPRLLGAEPSLGSPLQLRVFDTPSDGGGSLTVTWAPSPEDTASNKYQVLLHEGGAPPDPTGWKVVAEFGANSHYVREAKTAWWTRPGSPDDHLYVIKNGKGLELKPSQSYAVTVAAVTGQERSLAPPIVASPEANWMNWNQLNNLILAILFAAVVFYAINLAKRKNSPPVSAGA